LEKGEKCALVRSKREGKRGEEQREKGRKENNVVQRPKQACRDVRGKEEKESRERRIGGRLE